MKYPVLILCITALVWVSCRRDEECKPRSLDVTVSESMIDTFPGSPHLLDTVLKVKYVYERTNYISECINCCPETECTKTLSFQVTNLTTDDMELTLSLEGRGDHSFTVLANGTIDIDPLPDYCATENWGTVKKVEYN